MQREDDLRHRPSKDDGNGGKPKVEGAVGCLFGGSEQSDDPDETCRDCEQDNNEDHHCAVVLPCGAPSQGIALACEHYAERKDQIDGCG